MQTWTKTCGLPLLFHFEPHPYLDKQGFAPSHSSPNQRTLGVPTVAQVAPEEFKFSKSLGVADWSQNAVWKETPFGGVPFLGGSRVSVFSV